MRLPRHLSSRKVYLFIFSLILLTAVLVFSVNAWVEASVRKQIYSSLDAIPKQKTGVLLGTSKHLGNGWINLYYKYRIEAALALFKAGKIEYILISGDHGHKSYNEPEMMRDDLIAGGIPADRIFLDYAGFRTLDSIMRCSKVFGEDHFTVISQPFHNERAVFIANQKSLHAVAFNAQDVPQAYHFKVAVREKFARVKMLLDLVFNKQPRFYGPRIEIR
ncbi:MAG: vancomycin high temperature exclusion protein [Sphingobacteriales bacterium]|nr:MAG: vancomycin high temperature exclusion protein [Sphingobacteriales bacterium]